MNKKSLVLTTILFSLLLIILCGAEVVAQPSFPDAPDQTPIDGGLGLLAAAGGVYAYRKLRSKNIQQGVKK